MQHHVVAVTPTVDTSAYASGDQVGATLTLNGAAPGDGTGTFLRKLTVVDKAKQKSALTVWLFDEAPTVASADQAAADVSDAELVDKALGCVSVAAADYKDLANGSVATVALDLPFKPVGSSSLYALIVSGGTPTYAAASDLVLKFHFAWS